MTKNEKKVPFETNVISYYVDNKRGCIILLTQKMLRAGSNWFN